MNYNMDEIKIKFVPKKPRFILVFEGKEVTYYWKSFNKVMCWKNESSARKFIKENTFVDEYGLEFNKNCFKIVKLDGNVEEIEDEKK